MIPEIHRLLEEIDNLERIERQRLARAYLLPYDVKSQLIRSAKLEAYAEIKTLLAPSPAGQEWTCFHCGETFTTPGEARDHFGATEGADPGCLIDRVALERGGTPERGRGLLMALRKAEDQIAELRRELDHVENDARLYHESEGERRRLQKGHNTSWFLFLDSLEGERLVLAERVKELEAELASAPAGQEEPPHSAHRCSGCGHRWDARVTTAELCGDCWRRVQAVATCVTHTDPLVCLACEAEEDKRPEWQLDLEPLKALARTHRAPTRDPFAEQLSAALLTVIAEAERLRASIPPSGHPPAQEEPPVKDDEVSRVATGATTPRTRSTAKTSTGDR